MGIAFLGRQREFLRVNQRYCGFLGYNEDEILRRGLKGLLHPDDYEPSVALGVKLRSGKIPLFHMEQRCLHKDGSVVWTDTSIRTARDQQGNVLHTIAWIQDITERKQAEQALRESEESFRTVADYTYGWEIWINASGHPEYVSPSCERITGYKREDFVKDPDLLLRIVHPEDRAYVADHSRGFENQAPPAELDYRIITRGGEVRWLSHACQAVFTGDGHYRGRRISNRDITDRKMAEESLMHLNRELLAIGSCNQAMFRARDELSLLQDICRIVCDSAAYRMAWVGYAMRDTRKTVKPVAWGGVAEGYLDKIHVSWADDVYGQGPTGTCIRTGQICCIEDYVTDPRIAPWREEALKHRFRSSIALPLNDEDGSTYGAITIHASVPAAFTPAEIRLLTGLADDLAFGVRNLRLRERRKRAETELRKLSQAVEQSPASIIITDLTGAIEYVNPVFTRLTGYSLPEVAGKNPRLLKGDQTAAEEYRELWQRITHGQEWHGEFHNRKKNGEFFWELATISPILDPQGRATHFLAVKEDITERKLLEEQLRQSQKLDAIGQLAGGVAHDFNNVVASTMLRLSALQQRTDLDAEIQESLRELNQEARRAADLTRQLLIFSRRSVLQVQTLDLNNVVTNLLKMLRRMIGEHVTMQFEPNPALPPIDADPGMMEQVIMNLCVNARDAMPRGGSISIGLDSAPVERSQADLHPGIEPGRFVCLSVVDNGCGMDEATLKRIFEPFFTTKEIGKGVGLGLATVHGIVVQHKGWVEVESTSGEGTKFCVFLPASAQPVLEVPSPENTETVRGKETILLVEDESDLRQITAAILGGLGYAVHEAANGKEALEVWKQHHAQIDLLFSDMVMPGGMTGLELAEKVREDKPGLKVVLSSGYSAETVGRRFQCDANTALLQKPYRLEVLSKTVRECLERK